MPKFNWGISADIVDDYDASEDFSPYMGAIPPNGVYAFRIKILKFAAPDGNRKSASLRIGLELVPRNSDEQEFAGYFFMVFRQITSNNAFTYAPFLRAIGVSGTDFTSRTVGDQDGNIQRIGKWAGVGKEIILAQLADTRGGDGIHRKDAKWFGAYDGEATYSDDEDEYDEAVDDDEVDNDEVDDDDEEFEEEPEPPKKRRTVASAKPAGRKLAATVSRPAKRRSSKADMF